MHPLQITLPQTAVPILGSIIGFLMGVAPLPSGAATYIGSFVMVGATVFVLLESHKREARAKEESDQPQCQPAISAVHVPICSTPSLAAIAPDASADQGHLRQSDDGFWEEGTLPLSKAGMAALHVEDAQQPDKTTGWGSAASGPHSAATAAAASGRKPESASRLVISRWLNILPWRRQADEAASPSRAEADEEAANLLPASLAAPSA